MKVVRFITYDEADKAEDEGKSAGIGGLGGIMCNRMTWDRYKSMFKEEGIEYIEALKEYIIEHNIRRGGDWHQSDDNGAPLFSDGTSATYSYRAWGDLMAAIWSDIDDKDYCYMDFYMDRFKATGGDKNA